MKEDFENITLDFSPESLLLLNICIAIIMFGVALSIKKSHFLVLFNNPRPVLTGMFSQFILLPALTFLLILILKPSTGIALGMIMVAACPGGNVSNFFSMVGKGNVALSVSLTAIATVLAVVLTPLNFHFWSGLLEHQGGDIVFQLGFLDMFKTVSLILGLPLIVGIWFSHKFPELTLKISKPIKYLSFIILILFIAVALGKNFSYFLDYLHLVFIVVLLHNAIAFVSAYYFSKALKNKAADCRAITMETGIQNSGLALVIIFTFFNGNGPMSFVAAWWGVWHIVSGGILSQIWAKLN